MEDDGGQEPTRRPRFTRQEVEGMWAETLETAPSFAEALGKRLEEVRESRRRTTEDIAKWARVLGLTWHRTTVRQTERGKRSLTAVELLLLPLLYGRPLRELLPDETTWLTDAAAVHDVELWRVIQGADWDKPGSGLFARPGRWHLANQASSEELMEVVTRWASAQRGQWPHGAELRRAVAPDEAETKAAKKLGTTPHYVAYTARELWGHGLVVEREARLAERSAAPDSPRALQAARGHITRALLEELGPAVRAHEERRGQPEDLAVAEGDGFKLVPRGQKGDEDGEGLD